MSTEHFTCQLFLVKILKVRNTMICLRIPSQSSLVTLSNCFTCCQLSREQSSSKEHYNKYSDCLIKVNENKIVRWTGLKLTIKTREDVIFMMKLFAKKNLTPKTPYLFSQAAQSQMYHRPDVFIVNAQHIEVGPSPSKKKFVICFNDNSPSKMMKNAFISP